MDQKDSNTLIHVSRRAMASEFEVCFSPERCGDGVDFALESLDLVETLEEQLSFFQPASQIGKINCLAAHEPVEVEPWLFDLLRSATELCRETQGAYDITSSPLWEAWGFARRDGKIPSDAQLAEARRCVGSQFVELDPQQRTIRFCKPGMKINLGSIGKGYALDICGERLVALGMTDYLLHGGQSSVLARGVSAPDSAPRHDTAPGPWEVGIRHPRQPGHRLGVARLRNRGLGTSGGRFQSFRHRGRRYGHILDPRSGWPVEGVFSTTVLAPTAALADALSTAFHVMGPRQSLEYCRSHPEIGLVMVCPATKGGDVELHVAGLDDKDVVIDGG